MINIQRKFSEAGGLGLINFSEVPFEVKRIYWLFGTEESTSRGLHAHKTLKQFIFCLAGGFQIELDDGVTIVKKYLNPESEGILIEKSIWRVLSKFETGTIVVVFASAEYDPEDYIHDYEDFLEWVSLN
jgi:dTDP-4-dehydrorhamnose 3,5-epimerase